MSQMPVLSKMSNRLEVQTAQQGERSCAYLSCVLQTVHSMYYTCHDHDQHTGMAPNPTVLVVVPY